MQSFFCVSKVGRLTDSDCRAGSEEGLWPALPLGRGLFIPGPESCLEVQLNLEVRKLSKHCP